MYSTMLSHIAIKSKDVEADGGRRKAIAIGHLNGGTRDVWNFWNHYQQSSNQVQSNYH